MSLSVCMYTHKNGEKEALTYKKHVIITLKSVKEDKESLDHIIYA